MKAMSFLVSVLTLVLVVPGMLLLGVYIGEFSLGVGGGKFLHPTTQFVIAGMLAVMGSLYPLFSKFSGQEFVTAVVVAQVLVIAMTWGIVGWFDWNWAWRVTAFTTLPFAGSLLVATAAVWVRRRGGDVIPRSQDEDAQRFAPPNRGPGAPRGSTNGPGGPPSVS